MPSCVDNAAGDLRASMAFDDQRLELRGADFDDGEFRRDEEAVQEDEKRHQQHLQNDFERVAHSN
jgi:hypothetical protein